jgi:hypothetical protein
MGFIHTAFPLRLSAEANSLRNGGFQRNSSPLVWLQLVRLLPPRRIPLLRFQRLHSLKTSAPAGSPRSHHLGKPELGTPGRPTLALGNRIEPKELPPKEHRSL